MLVWLVGQSNYYSMIIMVIYDRRITRVTQIYDSVIIRVMYDSMIIGVMRLW